MVSSIVDSTGFSRWSNIPSIFHQTHTKARHLSEYTQKSYFGLMVWINSSENKIQCTMLPLFMCDYMYDVQMHVSWTWLWEVTFQNRTWHCHTSLTRTINNTYIQVHCTAHCTCFRSVHLHRVWSLLESRSLNCPPIGGVSLLKLNYQILFIVAWNQSINLLCNLSIFPFEIKTGVDAVHGE